MGSTTITWTYYGLIKIKPSQIVTCRNFIGIFFFTINKNYYVLFVLGDLFALQSIGNRIQNLCLRIACSKYLTSVEMSSLIKTLYFCCSVRLLSNTVEGNQAPLSKETPRPDVEIGLLWQYVSSINMAGSL